MTGGPREGKRDGRSGRGRPASRKDGGRAGSSKEDPAVDQLSFEDAFALAEKAVDSLERGELSLQDSLSTYETGVRSIKRCYDVIGAFSRKIEVLSGELGSVAEVEDGPSWQPAGASDSLRRALETLESGQPADSVESEDEAGSQDSGG